MASTITHSHGRPKLEPVLIIVNLNILHFTNIEFESTNFKPMFAHDVTK